MLKVFRRASFIDKELGDVIFDRSDRGMYMYGGLNGLLERLSVWMLGERDVGVTLWR